MTKRILIVDDDPVTLQVLGQLLTLEGFTVETFTNAEDALVHLSRDETDVLLTDFVLPAMSGLELVTEAKRIVPQLHCLVMSGHAKVPTAAPELPWLSKPVDVDELLSMLAKPASVS
jgi:DNA-binding NtrC family response regulator